MNLRKPLLYTILGLGVLGLFGQVIGFVGTTGHATGGQEAGCGGEDDFWVMTPAPADRKHQEKKDAKSWTLLYYGAADSNLDNDITTNVFEMAKVGSGPGLQVVVQIDRKKDGNHPSLKNAGEFQDTRRFLVEKGAVKNVGTLGELNTGMAGNLSDFVAWGVKTYPADRYALIISSHGYSWQGCCVDDTNNHDKLKLKNIHDGIKVGLEIANLKEFDLIGFDACLMGSLTVLETMSPFGEYLVASANTIPGQGWNYEAFLETISKNPAIGPVALGKAIVLSYLKKNKMSGKTLALFDLYQAPQVVSAVKEFADSLAQSSLWRPSLIEARSRFPKSYKELGYGQNGQKNTHVTLRYLMESFAKEPMKLVTVYPKDGKKKKVPKNVGGLQNTHCKSAKTPECMPFAYAAQLRDVLDAMTLFTGHNHKFKRPELTVYFPRSLEKFNADEESSGQSYDSIPSMSGWHEVLQRYYDDSSLDAEEMWVNLGEQQVFAAASGLSVQAPFQNGTQSYPAASSRITKKGSSGNKRILSQLDADIDFEQGHIRADFSRNHSLLRVSSGQSAVEQADDMEAEDEWFEQDDRNEEGGKRYEEPQRDQHFDMHQDGAEAALDIFVDLSSSDANVFALGLMDYVEYAGAEPQRVALEYHLDKESGESSTVLYLADHSRRSEIQGAPGSIFYPLVKELSQNGETMWVRSSEQGLPADQPLNVAFVPLEPSADLEIDLSLESYNGQREEVTQELDQEQIQWLDHGFGEEEDMGQHDSGFEEDPALEEQPVEEERSRREDEWAEEQGHEEEQVHEDEWVEEHEP